MKGVYKISSKATGKFYIGSSTTSIARRWKSHKLELKKKLHHNTGLQNLYDTHGEDDLVFEVISELSNEEEIEALEQKMLDQFYSTPLCLNECSDVNTRRGSKHSEKSKLLMSKAHKGRLVSIETRHKMSEAQKGRTFSEETRRKMSESAKNKVFSDSHKNAISKASSSMWNKRSKEENEKIVEKIRKSNTGQVFSEERKARISEALKNYWKTRRGESA
jgi:group I intron endonuclease